MLETIQQILMGALRGMGRTAALLRIQVIASCLIWLPLLFVLRAEHPTVTAYWLSMPVYMLSSAILLVLAIRKKGREKRADRFVTDGIGSRHTTTGTNSGDSPSRAIVN